MKWSNNIQQIKLTACINNFVWILRSFKTKVTWLYSFAWILFKGWRKFHRLWNTWFWLFVVLANIIRILKVRSIFLFIRSVWHWFFIVLAFWPIKVFIYQVTIGIKRFGTHLSIDGNFVVMSFLRTFIERVLHILLWIIVESRRLLLLYFFTFIMLFSPIKPLILSFTIIPIL